MKQAVIFDIDGTLLRSSHEEGLLYIQAVEYVLGPVKFRSTLTDYSYITDSGILSELLNDNGLETDLRTITAIKDRFLVATKKYVSDFGPFQEITGARNLLSRLQQSEKFTVAIATGGWRHTAQFKLASAGFELDEIPLKTSDDANTRIEIMQLALESLGDRPESITYYGDGSWDELACQKLGWSFRAVGKALRGIQSYEHEFIA